MTAQVSAPSAAIRSVLKFTPLPRKPLKAGVAFRRRSIAQALRNSLALIATVWAVGQARGAEGEKHERDEGVDIAGVPLLSFNSDTGVGFGAVGGAFFYGPGYRPYQHALSAQIFFTTFGIQGHYLAYDAPRLLGPIRVEAHLEFHRELYTPFYGAGNDTVPGETLDEAKTRLGYLGTLATLWVRFRLRPFGEGHPFQLYAGYQYGRNSVRPYPDSIIRNLQPPGAAGGDNPHVLGGILWDTRDDEMDATKGSYAELSGRMARKWTNSEFEYQGLSVSFRKYVPIFTPKFLLALHAAGDHLWGNVPFWEWVNFGGISHFEGIGGQHTVRGVPRDRYQGNTKVFGNAELRFYVIEFPALGATIKIGGDVFFDTGRVWHPGVPDGKLFQASGWHSGAGGGLRLARRAAVIRADYGVELGTGRQAIYLTFGQLF